MGGTCDRSFREENLLAEPKESGKRQASFYIETELIARLDRWIRWQEEKRNYKVDRSHVVNVLLRRFLDKNDQHIPDDYKPPASDGT
mgnify:CR=1 FL=1